MPLTMVRPGQEVKIIKMNNPETTCMRLVNMGITPGAPLRLISRSPSSLLVGVRETRIMLDNRIAHQIHVQ
ncbi:MAG: FeoA family protein [Veillonellales bacterium]